MILAFVDEVGFSPSQPVNASWSLPGQRKWIPSENPRSRRLNTMAALLPSGPEPSLWWGSVDHSFTAEHLLAFIRALATRGTPLVVVLDNASIPVSRRVHDERPALAAAGIELVYLPPYSPRLNPIEPSFGVIKQHEMPLRTDPTLWHLDQAVEQAFTRTEDRLARRARLNSPHHLWPAA